ncbi:uncharacterized protein Z518_09097 [Rhinocladiella mackenziei CBS 650.93]|uniref:Rhinocladiella mackenziei CBS 650.93 unplaced genomic scaffold supercont1.7, whole genome shotgun sequence n=1 Tax=Rhinocladiella mackenziei CBS 650.93 TaxID=1442369 RepID=A0A0D2FH68_9EURO|nr:uncharacterized protein Z518_09097 [Rhinocladiella mackenziei CBS 650.93]KIX01372.1 hypothetical protein Z518_09097 [Rhinocladiella mackenziei CBS 650.93]
MSPQPPNHGTKLEAQPLPKPPFDIDIYLNPFIPHNPMQHLPLWISHFFGYRPPRKLFSSPHPYHRFHTLTIYISVLIGSFCGVAIIENVFRALPTLSGQKVPLVIASFGAAAILEYNAIESPLAQPRNLICGHFLSAAVGVGITKLFERLPPDRFNDLQWLAGALSVGAASVIMSFTKSVHPPAGATALLAATALEIQLLGWWLLPLVLLASMLMLASALLLNNIAGRRFPVYWWTPVDLKALREERRRKRKARRGGAGVGEGTIPDETQKEKDADIISDDEAETDSQFPDLRTSLARSLRLARSVSYSSASRIPHPLPPAEEAELQNQLSLHETLRGTTTTPTRGGHQIQTQTGPVEAHTEEKIIISRHSIVVPEWLQLSDWEDEVLRILMERLRDG